MKIKKPAKNLFKSNRRKVKHIMKKLHKQNGLKRSNSAIEFDVSALTAANRRHIYSR